jgi:two-component SAPR family response regulator
MSLSMRGQRAEALAVYNTAERLYSGDLFADIPVKYLEDNQEDWCMNRRVWFRDMALKLQSHMAGLLRGQGRLREALEHCQKALALDPSNDDANMEAMRVFHAQGRFDAVGRQYKQYRKAMQSIDATPEGTEVQALFLALTSR